MTEVIGLFCNHLILKICLRAILCQREMQLRSKRVFVNEGYILQPWNKAINVYINQSRKINYRTLNSLKVKLNTVENVLQ